MKYKLTQSAIEKLEAIEFETSDKVWIEYYGNKRRIFLELEPIAEKLPKPRLKSVEDLKALYGWRLYSESNLSTTETVDEWGELYHKYIFDNCVTLGYKIRQIDMPENEYLVADCIEQEIEYVETKLEAKVREIIKKVLKEEAGE